MSYDLERPDGLLGHMLALEGVSDSMTVLHGPTGCKMYPSNLSENLYRDRNGVQQTMNVLLNRMEYFFYQPRIPCTFLDGRRLVMGASERLEDLYRIAVSEGPGIIGIINSPGSSLTGEDLSKVDSGIPTVRAESPGFSLPFQDGYSECAVKIIDALCTDDGTRDGSVNIIGLSIWHVRFRDSINELKRMLSLCGVTVNCVLCAGSSSDEIRTMPRASLNIVVDPDFGLKIAEHLREKFGTPFTDVMPLGFEGTSGWIDTVCSMLHKDGSEAKRDLMHWRKIASETISKLYERGVNFKGRTFSVHSTPAFARTLSSFLYGYLGMIPVAIQTDPKNDGVFGNFGLPINDRIWDTDADILFGSGSEISSLTERGLVSGGVEICEPSNRPVCIAGRPVFGTMGSVFITEDALNILIRIADRI